MKPSLPTVHEIIEHQKQFMPPDTFMPVVTFNKMSQAVGNPDPAQEHTTSPIQQSQVTSGLQSEFALSHNSVINSCWQKASLLHFTNKLNAV
jgi:hypothetical protein